MTIGPYTIIRTAELERERAKAKWKLIEAHATTERATALAEKITRDLANCYKSTRERMAAKDAEIDRAGVQRREGGKGMQLDLPVRKVIVKKTAPMYWEVFAPLQLRAKLPDFQEWQDPVSNNRWVHRSFYRFSDACAALKPI